MLTIKNKKAEKDKNKKYICILKNEFTPKSC